MGSERAPAYQWYPKDYLSSSAVNAMSLEEEGAYRRLLDFEWLDGSIPSSLPALARLCRVTPARMGRIWPGIMACFVEHPDQPGRLVNERLERQRNELHAHREQNRLAGLASAEAKRQRALNDRCRSVGTEGERNANETPTLLSATASATAVGSGASLRSAPAAAPAAGPDEPHPGPPPEPARKRPRKPDPGALSLPDGSPAVRAFTDGWLALFERHKGHRYAFAGAKDGTHVAEILKLAGARWKPPSSPEDAARAVALALSRAESLLTSTDPFFVTRGVDIGLLRSQWNRIASAGRGLAPIRDIRVGSAPPSPPAAVSGRVAL